MNAELLKELAELNTAIAKAEANLQALKERRTRINCQISDCIMAASEMEAIAANLKKTREALTI